MTLRTARWIHPAAPQPAATGAGAGVGAAGVGAGAGAGAAGAAEAACSRLLLLELMPNAGCVDFANQLALVRRTEPLVAAPRPSTPTDRPHAAASASPFSAAAAAAASPSSSSSSPSPMAAAPPLAADGWVVDGFYRPRLDAAGAAGDAGLIVCARRQPVHGASMPGRSPSYSRTRPDGAPLARASAEEMRDQYEYVEAREAAGLWLRAALASGEAGSAATGGEAGGGEAGGDTATGCQGANVHLLCGALLPSLPYLRQVLGGRLAVRRATLLSGQVNAVPAVPPHPPSAIPWPALSPSLSEWPDGPFGLLEPCHSPSTTPSTAPSTAPS